MPSRGRGVADAAGAGLAVITAGNVVAGAACGVRLFCGVAVAAACVAAIVAFTVGAIVATGDGLGIGVAEAEGRGLGFGELASMRTRLRCESGGKRDGVGLGTGVTIGGLIAS